MHYLHANFMKKTSSYYFFPQRPPSTICNQVWQVKLTKSDVSSKVIKETQHFELVLVLLWHVLYCQKLIETKAKISFFVLSLLWWNLWYYYLMYPRFAHTQLVFVQDLSYFSGQICWPTITMSVGGDGGSSEDFPLGVNAAALRKRGGSSISLVSNGSRASGSRR